MLVSNKLRGYLRFQKLIQNTYGRMDVEIPTAFMLEVAWRLLVKELDQFHSSETRNEGTQRSAASKTQINKSGSILFISQLRASAVKEHQSENTLEVMNILVCNSLCSRFVALISCFSLLSDTVQYVYSALSHSALQLQRPALMLRCA